MNVLMAVDGAVLDAIDEKETEAAALRERLSTVYREIADLRALADVRRAMGATLTPIRMLAQQPKEIA